MKTEVPAGRTMPTEPHLTLIARTIQLLVAPVFSLTAIGTTLAVLSNRLSRIVDRARVFEERMASLLTKEQNESRTKLSTLSQHSKSINAAITLGTLCAILICSVIAIMFIGVFLSIDLTYVVALLFVTAVLAFIGALLAFCERYLSRLRPCGLGCSRTLRGEISFWSSR